MSGRILNVTEDQYFADPCSVPSLSQSIAHVLISESPKHAWLRHPKLGGLRSEPTKATDTGHVIHKMLLGKGAAIDVLDVTDFRTKDAQRMRDESIAAGRIPMKRAEYQAIEDAAEILRGHLSDLGYDLIGESEVAYEWHEPAHQGPVLCRARMDHVILDLPNERATILDIKKAESVNPKKLRRHFYDYGYDIQHCAYTNALGTIYPQLVGRIDFIFLFLEMNAPHSIVHLRPSGAMREIGLSRWTRAVDIWQRCLTRNEWPSYCGKRPIELEPMPYQAQEELGADYA